MRASGCRQLQHIEHNVILIMTFRTKSSYNFALTYDANRNSRTYQFLTHIQCSLKMSFIEIYLHINKNEHTSGLNHRT